MLIKKFSKNLKFVLVATAFPLLVVLITAFPLVLTFPLKSENQGGAKKVEIAAVVKDLTMPYYLRQVGDTKNTFDGTTACGATSAVMITAYYNRLTTDPIWCTFCDPDHWSPYGKYVSEIYTRYGYTFDISSPDGSNNAAYGAYGYIHDNSKNAVWTHARGYFRRHGLFSEVIYSPSETDVKTEIANDRPVWASTTFYSGHIVVIKGYTEYGNYIVHDPWPEGYGWCYNGADMSYSWSNMGTGSKGIVTAKPIAPGNQVKALDGTIHVRDAPNGNDLGYVGDFGTILDDSTYGCFHNAGGYTWWKIAWDNGKTGWSAIGDFGYGENWIILDTIPPAVDFFSVTPQSVTLGNTFTIDYTVSDITGFGLKQVELWRANDVNGEPDWPAYPITTTSLSGQTSYSGFFTDVPPSIGTYWYGLHVVDTSGNWNDEQNARTGGSPGDFGPLQREVNGLPEFSTLLIPFTGTIVIFWIFGKKHKKREK